MKITKARFMKVFTIFPSISSVHVMKFRTPIAANCLQRLTIQNITLYDLVSSCNVLMTTSKSKNSSPMSRLLSLPLSFLLVVCSGLALLKAAMPENQSLDRLVYRTWIYQNPDLVRNARAQLRMEDTKPSGGTIQYFETALIRDAASPHRWRDLGRALARSGQTAKAIPCYRRSVDLGPNSPTTLVRAASFFVGINEPLEALPYYSRALQLIPNWDTNIFEAYSQMPVGFFNVLDLGIGAHRRPAQAFFRYLLSRPGKSADLEAAWNWVELHSLSDDPLAAAYIDFLLKNRMYEKAATIWARHLGERKDTYMESNYLLNGDFEKDLTGAILDWRIKQTNGVLVKRDSSFAHSGNYSLMIQFNGEQNPAYSHVSQTAFVRPGRYRFEGYIRTAGITTDQGIGFKIFDSQLPARINLRIGNITGTNDWTRVGITFTVPKDTNVVTVAVVRDSSLKFDNQIRGAAWFDSITLTPE
ncbi:MAG: tetratricopeptide repeat protein [Nitrospirota bacterium]|nr:tetratricopeptide repeat protein [Nitrospirota bacterium]